MSQKKLRIGYFADGPWSHRAFEIINNDDRFDIQFIVPRTDTTDMVLSDFSKKYNIDYFKLDNVNSPSSLEKIKTYDCDVLVSMSFNQIFRKGIINLTPKGIINCHAGKLPFYRGRNILNWALINDEKEFGITVHFVDEGIDTGDIILQDTFPITDEDDYASLLEVAFVECSRLLYDALVKIAENDYERIDQKTIHPVGFYCGRRGVGDEIINWNDTSRNLFNFIRSISTPGPIARTVNNSQEIKINKSRLIPDVPNYIGTVGQVLSKTESGFLVKTKDSFIEILDVDGKIRVGDKLGK
ncbi:formyl transferase [Winogradskyella sp. J14-2]|uniref:Formyltransferase family protein n=1 Tax=Winogradskyella poriferorum TaxID=307627 RepID=A0ABU7W0U2_9FLAO|nr:formyltransferase family protein [Winogradskyella sp. J14-2]APY07947.1 formyl transferase [Winogradskyella sp. J14-2]